MSKELKPCPFCGGEDVAVKQKKPNLCVFYVVKCQNPECSAETAAWTQEESAIKAWNRRATE